MNQKLKVAIIGPGNIGTDLMIKVLRNAKYLEMGAMVGIDAASDGLARAQRMGVATTHAGVEGLIKPPRPVPTCRTRRCCARPNRASA